MLSKQLNEQTVNNLYKEIPEFEKYVINHIDKEFVKNAYLVFGPFGRLLTDWITGQASQQLINKSYCFINQLCENADSEMEQMLKVTFFEHLTDFKKTIEVSRSNFKGKALIFFEEVLNGPIFEGGKYAT